MDLEQELRDKINSAREEAQQAEEEVVDSPAIEDIPPEEVEEVKPDVDDSEPEKEVQEVQEEEAVDTDSDNYKDLTPDSKKFQHMRHEAKEKDRTINELRERMARLEGRQEVITEQKPVKDEVVVDIPDKDLEPEAYLDYHLAQKDKQIQSLNDKFDTFTQKAGQDTAENVYKSLESKYSEKDKSYSDAKTFLWEATAEEIRVNYPSATDAQISQHLKEEEYKMVASLAQSGCGEDVIFGTIKAQAISKGFKEVSGQSKKDNTKLRSNIKKSASLNDAPAGSGELGFSPTQMSRMKSADFHKLAGNPGELKKAQQALMAARIKAMG